MLQDTHLPSSEDLEDCYAFTNPFHPHPTFSEYTDLTVKKLSMCLCLSILVACSKGITNTEHPTYPNEILNPNFECKKPYYAEKPALVSSDGTHRYYEYYWQSAPKLCVNFYEPDLIDDPWETRIKDGLEFGKSQLGLLVPLNATVVDQKMASQATLAQIDRDTCDIWRVPAGQTLQNCLANPDPWGNRFAAAGVTHASLPNGGELHFFQDLITDYENNPGMIVRILMHEFYHVYQNSMKFYFESNQRFGIPKRWEDDPETYLHDTDFVAVFPNWIEEGGADFAGIVLATKFDNSIDARQDWLDHLDEARNVVRVAADNEDIVSLKDYEYQGGLYESPDNPNNGIARELAYQYSGGAVALAYLWSLDDRNFKKIMVDYYSDYAEKDHANLGSGWKDSFEGLFGMTLDEFYTDFDAFMLEDRATQISIFKTNLEIQQAPIS